MKWQVQIWVNSVEEWFGWAHHDYDESDRADAERVAKIAKQYGWKTRVVQVA